MTTWFNYTYGVGIQLNIDCTFNVDGVCYCVYCLFRSFMLFTLGVHIYLSTVIHPNIHVVRIVLFFYIEDSLGTLVQFLLH